MSREKRFLVALLAAASLPLWAAEDPLSMADAASTPPGVTSSGELTLLASSLPEVKLAFGWRWIIPVLRVDNFLMEENSLGLSLQAEVSPVSLGGLAEAVFTPAAFFQLSAGGRLAFGWTIDLFGSKSIGAGLNRDDGTGADEYAGRPFDGLVWKAHTGAAFQFDFAAIVPGDWHHVVARTYHEINRKGYTAAGAGESWFFENDDGENVNGWNYYGNLLLGYQMPIILNTVALLAEADLYLYDTPGRERWGDEKIRWTFSAMANFRIIARRLDAAVILQLRTRRNYDDEGLYYRNRTIDPARPLRLEFYRVVAAITYRF